MVWRHIIARSREMKGVVSGCLEYGGDRKKSILNIGKAMEELELRMCLEHSKNSKKLSTTAE